MLTCNIDHETGVRFGVIHSHKVDYVWDSFEPDYPECECEDYCQCECIGHSYSREGYCASIDEYGDIFILKSPFYTLCGLCSPCAPNAGYLTSEGEYMTYCFGHDWFEGGKAPYTVYSVKTGLPV